LKLDILVSKSKAMIGLARQLWCNRTEQQISATDTVTGEAGFSKNCFFSIRDELNFMNNSKDSIL
jgi:hypothetical protein